MKAIKAPSLDADRNYVALDKNTEAEKDKPTKLKDSIEPVDDSKERLPSNAIALEAKFDLPSTQEEVAEVNNENYCVSNPESINMRLLPSYSQAVDLSTDNINDDLYKTGSRNTRQQPRQLYKDGNYYVNVETEDTGEV